MSLFAASGRKPQSPALPPLPGGGTGVTATSVYPRASRRRGVAALAAAVLLVGVAVGGFAALIWIVLSHFAAAS